MAQQMGPRHIGLCFTFLGLLGIFLNLVYVLYSHGELDLVEFCQLFLFSGLMMLAFTYCYDSHTNQDEGILRFLIDQLTGPLGQSWAMLRRFLGLDETDHSNDRSPDKNGGKNKKNGGPPKRGRGNGTGKKGNGHNRRGGHGAARIRGA